MQKLSELTAASYIDETLRAQNLAKRTAPINEVEQKESSQPPQKATSRYRNASFQATAACKTPDTVPALDRQTLTLKAL
jgi:hypothetical protein